MILVDAAMIAAMTREPSCSRCDALRRSEATVRSWAHRGLLTRRGTGRNGRALYDAAQAQEVVGRLVAIPRRAEHHTHG